MTALEKLVDERLTWAEARLAEKAGEYEKWGLPKAFAGGEKFPFLGEDYFLVIVESRTVKRTRCEFSGDRFFVEIPPGSDQENATMVRKALFKWYKREAEKDIAKRIAAWAPVVGKAPASVTIRNQKARWGSCSVKGSINFNWRLAMAQPAVIDYVVVHELCHLLEHNHSKDYWMLVEKVMPDYKALRRKLKGLSHLLEIT